MSSGQVIKRAKYKTSVKDPGTPGLLKMVFLFLSCFFPLLRVLLLLFIVLMPADQLCLSGSYLYVNVFICFWMQSVIILLFYLMGNWIIIETFKLTGSLVFHCAMSHERRYPT